MRKQMKMGDCHIPPYLADSEGYLANADGLKIKCFTLDAHFSLTWKKQKIQVFHIHESTQIIADKRVSAGLHPLKPA